MKKDEITIREFRTGDAAACFRIRSDAFIQTFHDILDPAAIAGCVNAYMPSDFVGMSETQQWFVAEDGGGVAGFSTVVYLTPSMAELLFLYVGMDRRGRGVGSALLRHTEDWLRENRPEITDFVLDTVVPDYNGPFYEKLGFEVIRPRLIDRHGTRIQAIQMGKSLRPQPRER